MRWISRILVGLLVRLVIAVITFFISYTLIEFLITETAGRAMLSFPEAIGCSSCYMLIAGLAGFVVVLRLLGERNLNTMANMNGAVG